MFGYSLIGCRGGKRGRLCSFFYVHSIFLSAAVYRFRLSEAVAYDYGYSVSRFKYGFGAEASVLFFFIGFKKRLVFLRGPKSRGRFAFLPQTSNMLGNVTRNQERRPVRGGAVGLLSELETGFFWKGRKRASLMEMQGVVREKERDML